jgi:hypothetical protein
MLRNINNNMYINCLKTSFYGSWRTRTFPRGISSPIFSNLCRPSPALHTASRRLPVAQSQSLTANDEVTDLMGKVLSDFR